MTGVPANCPMTRDTASTADPGASDESAAQTRFSRPPSTKKVESQTRSFGDDTMAAMDLFPDVGGLLGHPGRLNCSARLHMVR
jgi:hypothetical protein